MVCAMVYTDKKLRSMTNYLVVSLSVADLLIAVVFVPFYIIDHYARTVIGDYFVAFILLATVFNLCGVTFERYIALTRPFRYRMIMTCQTVTIIVFVSWLLPLVLSLLPLASNSDVDSNLLKVYIVVVLSLFIFAPCTTMVCVYMRVLRVAHRFIMRSKGRTSKGNITGQMAGKDEKANRAFAKVFGYVLAMLAPFYLHQYLLDPKPVTTCHQRNDFRFLLYATAQLYFRSFHLCFLQERSSRSLM